MKKYEDAERYLATLINYEKKGFKGGEKLGLGRMRAALKELGSPHKGYISAHIAGTKGKGSVSAFTASILTASGMPAGLYTSPHLSTPRERISLGGKMISKSEFADGIFYIRKTLSGKVLRDITYFEMMTLLAMWYFSSAGVDAAVFETGLGGRLDATNVIKPVVCVITPISYDHTRILGKSLRSIAAEKAAIIKKGTLCLCATQKRSALKVIEARCSEVGVRILKAGRDIDSRVKEMGPDGGVFDIVTPSAFYRDCRTLMPGEFQAENAALAAAACQALWRSSGKDDVNPKAVKKGISKAFLPGRMESLSVCPRIIIDGAHNAESASRLAASVRKIFSYRKLVLITAFCGDKDIKGSCAALREIADTVIVTRAMTSRAAPPEKIAGYFTGKKVIITGDPGSALKAARAIAESGDLILAAGSFYLAGEIRGILKGKIG